MTKTLALVDIRDFCEYQLWFTIHLALNASEQRASTSSPHSPFQNTESHTALLEADIRSLEGSIQTLKAHRRADDSQVTQLKTDLTELLAKAQDRENTYAHLLDEVGWSGVVL